MSFPDNAPGAGRRPAPTWLKILGIGCGGVIVVLFVAAGLVASHWSALTGYYRQATSMVSDISTVQAALRKKYDAEAQIGVSRKTGIEGSILSITLVNPPLMDHTTMDGPDGRRAALDVATTARDSLPPSGRYENYEVVFQREGGSANATVSGSWSFRFTASDLPQEKSSTIKERPRS